MQLYAEHVVVTWTWSSPGGNPGRGSRASFFLGRKARAAVAACTRQWLGVSVVAEDERSCTRNTSWRRPLPPAPRLHHDHLPASFCSGICHPPRHVSCSFSHTAATSHGAAGQLHQSRPHSLPLLSLSLETTICTIAVLGEACKTKQRLRRMCNESFLSLFF